MYDTSSTGCGNAGQHSGRGFGRCGRKAATENVAPGGMPQGEMPQDGMGQNCMRMRHGRRHGAFQGKGSQNEERGPVQGCRQARGHGYGHGMCRGRNMDSAPACSASDDAAN